MFKKCVTLKPFSALKYLVRYSTPLIILCLVFVAPGCKKSQDESMKGKEDKSTGKTLQDATKQESKEKVQLPTAAESEEATLTLVNISKNTFGIDLKNSAPVRLIQFTVNGIEDAQVRSTKRTDGFLIKFTKDNKKVTILSPSGNTIAPGSGFIVEMSCDAATATLSEIKIAK
jgi:adenine deaminase